MIEEEEAEKAWHFSVPCTTSSYRGTSLISTIR
jgi:hypothetical protein